MAKVYISYSGRDVDTGKQIFEGLRALGQDVSIDIDSLSAGQQWQKTLSEALKNAEVFVSLLSESSISSAFVLSELGAARAFSQADGSMLILPVILGTIQVPPIIQDIHCIFSPERNAEQIVRQINDAILSFLGRKAAEEKQRTAVESRIETNSAEYIEETIHALQEQEARDRSEGKYWYYLGYATLVLGAVLSFFGIASANIPVVDGSKFQWVVFAYSALKSIIVIGLLVACSKYSFTLGRASMSEALKSANRIHAISFGRFYLRAFGAKADWSELKEVFQHWNIDNSSPLSTLDTQQFDPKFLETVVEVAKTLTTKLEPKK